MGTYPKWTTSFMFKKQFKVILVSDVQMIKVAMMSFCCLHNKTLTWPCGMVINCFGEKPLGQPCGFHGLEECVLVTQGQLVDLACFGRCRKWANGFPYFLSLFLRITKPFKHLIEKTVTYQEGNAGCRHSSLKCTYENSVFEYEIIVYINVYLLKFPFNDVQRLATLQNRQSI